MSSATHPKSFLYKLYLTGFSLIFLASGISLNLRLETLQKLSSAKETPDGVQKWDPRLFQILSFGHVPMAIDWLLLRFLIADPSIKHVEKGVRAPLYYDLDAASDLDPAFYSLYTTGGNYLTAVKNDNEGALALLEKGNNFRKKVLPTYPAHFRERFWGGGWGIPLVLSYLYLFEFQDLPKATAMYEEAAAYANAPPYLSQLKERLKKPDGRYEVGIRFLNFMMKQAPNEAAVEELEKKRNSLFLSQYLFRLNYEFRDFLRTRPDYARSEEVSKQKLQQLWKKFRSDTGIPNQDPWGGQIFLDEEGKVTSTTPRRKVLGME